MMVRDEREKVFPPSTTRPAARLGGVLLHLLRAAARRSLMRMNNGGPPLPAILHQQKLIKEDTGRLPGGEKETGHLPTSLN